ncbi:MAG: hypothetical protein JW776_15845 [Candidatus Lokiarchaeota archaeon]|nr:hypothetical protein [Candidatus Lokiarchaeota archaeon]
MREKRKNILYLSISLVLIVLLPTMAEFTNNFYTTSIFDEVTNPFDGSDSTQIDERITIINASQYNVSEYAYYRSPKTDILIKNENLSMGIPNNWETSVLSLSVPSVFEALEIFNDYGLNGDFSGGTANPWEYYTTHSWYSGIPMSEPYANFTYDSLDENAYADFYGGNKGFPVRSDFTEPAFFGAASTTIPDFDKSDSNLEFGELYEEETTEFSINDEFFEDPEYNVILDPYGGYRGNSKVTGNWIAGINALENIIDTRWSLLYGYGSPSVCFSTPFYIPFEADSVSITFRWSVENLGYEYADDFLVASRINHQYINGSVGLYGEDYSVDTLDYTVLEYDGTRSGYGSGDIRSHEYWERTYNITELLGPYGYHAGWHTLDFGIALLSPDSTDDDVIVNWDYIMINATHYDWYKSAELNFEFLWEDLGSTDPNGNLAFSIYIGEEGTDNFMRYFIGYSTQLQEGSWNEASIILPQHYHKAFEVDTFNFFVGMEDAGPLVGPPETTVGFYRRLTVDNFYLTVNFDLGPPETLGLEMKLNDGTNWMQVNSTNEIYTEIQSTTLEVQFNLTTNPISDSYIRFQAYIVAKKFSEHQAFSTVSIHSFNDLSALWNTTYNNTESVNEFDDPSLLGANSKFLLYLLRFENLPAFDGMGDNSNDWNVYRAVDPNARDQTLRIIKNSNDPFLQNITIYNATSGNRGSLTRGLWELDSSQVNYMVNGSLYLDGGINNEIYYNGDLAEYHLYVRNSSGIFGNYKTQIWNATLNTTTNFPKYYSNVNNATYDWTVFDEGVGLYRLYNLWNDTNSLNQTRRLGWYRDTFEVWRHTTASILEGTLGVTVSSGESAVYHIQFNQTSVGTSGVTGAHIYAYNASSGNLWGRDIPPYVYLLDYLTDDSGGAYTIALKTISVPTGSYQVNFTIYKAFHEIFITLNTGLTITGALGSMDITYNSGAFIYQASPTRLYLDSNNIPYVNDSTNSVIEITLEDSTSSARLRDAYISASFNDSSSSLMIAREKYSITFVESDKGVYILTINTVNLHVTNGSPFFNYTLQISYYKPGYALKVHRVEVQIDPVPLVITPEPILPQYEEEILTIQATTFANNTGILSAYEFCELNYSVYNSSGYIFGGSLPKKIFNFFEINIELISTHDLHPGEYYVILNGTGIDLSTSVSGSLPFTIYSKYVTLLSLTFPNEVRIGNYFSISSKLQYANLTVLASEEIFLTINYSTIYSFQVSVQTDYQGRGIYELLIPEYYEGNDFTVYAQYFGTNILNPSQTIKNQIILGKIPVNITFIDTPETIQVGYSVTYQATLSILYEQDYEGKILTMYGYYDFDGNLSQPFLIRELAASSDGLVSYTIDEIENGHINLSVFLEFQGDISTEDQFNSINGSIIPKWDSSFVLQNFPSTMRLGQTVPIDLTLNSTNITFSESFAVMPIIIKFDYGTVKQEFLYYTDENGTLSYNVKIPDSDVSVVNYSVYFPGTSKIEPFLISGSMLILPKLGTILEMDSFVLGQQRTGTFSYSAILQDEFGFPVPNATVYFRIYDENDLLIDSPFTTTNKEGVAAISITFEQSGTYKIIAEFDGTGIYSTTTSQEIIVEAVSDLMYFVGFLPYIGGSLAVVVAGGFIYQYAVVVPRRKKRLRSLKAIHQRFSDVENIQYILILTKTGLSVFSRSFTSVPIEETLISGFLSAISSFGAEIGTKMKQSESTDKGLEQLSYKQFKIIVDDLAIVRTALLLLKDASPDLKEKLRRFNLRFQEKYMGILQNWTGEIPAEGPILEMVEEFLEVDLLYPHNVNVAKLNENLKTLEKKSINHKILEAAHSEPFGDVFYIREMMNHLRATGEEDIHIFNGIIELVEKNAIFAINPRTRILIDQFKPIIDQLSEDAKIVLLQIYDGNKNESKLRRIKEISNFDQGSRSLIQMGLIQQDLSLTPAGEAIATILKLI